LEDQMVGPKAVRVEPNGQTALVRLNGGVSPRRMSYPALHPDRAIRIGKVSGTPDPQRGYLRTSQGPAMTSRTPSPQCDCPVTPAVLIERFEVKVVREAVFLTLFGVGVGGANSPLKHAPAFTAFLRGADATQLVQVLQQGVTALHTLKADATNPQ
jgi:hypothetical protein